MLEYFGIEVLHLFIENIFLTFILPISILTLCTLLQIVMNHSFDNKIESNGNSLTDIHSYIRGHVSVLFHKNITSMVGNVVFYSACMYYFEMYFNSTSLMYILIDLTLSYGLVLSVFTVLVNKLNKFETGSNYRFGFMGFDGVCYSLFVSLSMFLYSNNIDRIEIFIMIAIVIMYEVVSNIICQIKGYLRCENRLHFVYRYLGIFIGLIYYHLIKYTV